MSNVWKSSSTDPTLSMGAVNLQLLGEELDGTMTACAGTGLAG